MTASNIHIEDIGSQPTCFDLPAVSYFNQREASGLGWGNWLPFSVLNQWSRSSSVPRDQINTLWAEHAILLIAMKIFIFWLQYHRSTITRPRYVKRKPRDVSLARYSDVITKAMASTITGVSIVYSTVCLGAKHKDIKAPRHWPLWREFSVGQRICRINGGKCFYMMTSSYITPILVDESFFDCVETTEMTLSQSISNCRGIWWLKWRYRQKSPSMI